MVFARPTPDAAYEVVSVLGLTDWKPRDIVKSQRIVNASRDLEFGVLRIHFQQTAEVVETVDSREALAEPDHIVALP